jgi:hypothetical protein
MEQIPESFPTISKQMRRMNRGMLTNVPKETITKAINLGGTGHNGN